MKTVIIALICLTVLSAVICSRDSKEWKIVSSARADSPITFHVALHQRNTELLEVINFNFFYLYL